jgi:molybdopterin molybdotransferase
MIPASEAELTILNLVQPLSQTEAIDIADATGRVLADSIASRLDFPHWDNSAMDGYAVRFADIAASSQTNGIALEVIEEIPAGSQPQREIQSGQAARIFTGAILPSGADTIVMQEDTTRQGNIVSIRQAPKLGAFVRHRGEYARSGDLLLTPGCTLNPPEIGLLAATGCSQVTVYRRPRVAILSTGDELVPPSQILQPGQIVDSNHYAIASFVRQAGAIPIWMGIVPDDRAKLTAAMSESIDSADCVISTGGVSVGDYDYVEDILAELGGDIHIRSVAIKPGKPLTVANFRRDNRRIVYFGLPGNPVSALVSCWRFLLPAIHKLAGLPPSTWTPTWVAGVTTEDLRADGKRETYLWGKLTLVDGQYHFTLSSGSHSSGNLINLVGTNALALIPMGTTIIHAGKKVKILAIGS